MGAEGSSLAGAEAALVDGEHHRGRGKVAQRREHSVEFAAAIAEFDRQHAASPSAAAPGAARIRVAVRKRPLFEHESAKKDFDVVSCGAGGVWLHRTAMRADLKHMVCESFDFEFDTVFSEADDTDAVFRAAVEPLVAATAASGGVSTVMCFGQTGSGKTYTTNGVAERAAAALFAALPAGASVLAVCVEVAGSKIHDLLSDGADVSLLEDGDGRVHLKGAAEHPTADAAALQATLVRAQASRAAAATGVHDASSRSHSVCRVLLRDADGAELGRLDLVDLAGSEWAADREQHSAERQREGAEINTSLMTLKACMRSAMAEGPGGEAATRLPYRQHALTKLLKDSFTGAEARTVLLATLSPSSADTEHSLSTLQHVGAIANSGRDEGAAEPEAESEVLQTEASKVARRVLTTNVPQAQELLRAAEQGGAAEPGAAEEEVGWEGKNPIDWSSADVAVWWTAAADRGVTQVNAAVAATPAEPPAPPPTPTADETLQLVLEEAGEGPLGLAFVKAPASAAGLPVVSGVKPDTAVAAALSAGGGVSSGLKGWRLLGVSTRAKADLAAAAGMHPAAALPAERARAEVLAELKAHAKDRPLTLLLWPPAAPAENTGPIGTTPKVPRIFTGKSRLGEADGGYLCERFTLKRFTTECGEEARLARLMYQELHQIIAETGGPYLPGVDGGAAQGGDGGERARRKAEEHAAAEAAKWGR